MMQNCEVFCMKYLAIRMIFPITLMVSLLDRPQLPDPLFLHILVDLKCSCPVFLRPYIGCVDARSQTGAGVL